MSFDPDDPRLTAYALGEAAENDRQDMETLRAESAEARAEVEQTRAFARAITAEYAREQAAYLADKPAADLPAKVVAFPGARRPWWQHGIGPGLKAAAVLVLAASLVYLTRRPRREEPAIVAARPTNALAVPTAAPLVAFNGPLDDAPRSAKDADGLNTRRAFTLEPSPAATLTVATPSPAQKQNSSGDQEFAARADVVPATSAAAAPPPEDRVVVAASLPESASVTGGPGDAPSVDARIARSVVRVRSSAGVFSGGVIMSSDGLILSIAPAMPPPLTVRLADQREFPATVEPEKGVAGWSWLKIDAGVVPAVSLAAEVPATDLPLVLPTVNPQSGRVSFTHGGSAPTGGRAAFAFNAAAELLLVEPAVPLSKSSGRMKAAADRAAPVKTIVRPLTAAEREMLRRANEHPDHK